MRPRYEPAWHGEVRLGGVETDIVVNALKLPGRDGRGLRDLQSLPQAHQAPRSHSSMPSSGHPSVERANATLRVPDSFAHELFYSQRLRVYQRCRRKQARGIIEPLPFTCAMGVARAPNFLFDECQGSASPAHFYQGAAR